MQFNPVGETRRLHSLTSGQRHREGVLNSFLHRDSGLILVVFGVSVKKRLNLHFRGSSTSTPAALIKETLSALRNSHRQPPIAASCSRSLRRSSSSSISGSGQGPHVRHRIVRGIRHGGAVSSQLMLTGDCTQSPLLTVSLTAATAATI